MGRPQNKRLDEVRRAKDALLETVKPVASSTWITKNWPVLLSGAILGASLHRPKQFARLLRVAAMTALPFAVRKVIRTTDFQKLLER